MTDKISDNDIKKALECCSSNVTFENCTYCSYKKDWANGITCIKKATKNALSYINRLEAENERLLQKTQRPPDVDPMDFCGVLCDFAEGLIKKAKAEAYKEFAERLEKLFAEIESNLPQSHIVDKTAQVFVNTLQILKKEMVGD